MKNTIITFIILFVIATPIWAQTASDFNVTLTEDGTGVVINEYTGSVLQVRIPSTIEGLPVREIGRSAFGGYNYIGKNYIDGKINKNITSVIIPEGVTIIRAEAFKDCSKLASVVLPNTLTKIEGYAFNSCPDLKTITLPSNLTYIGERAFSKSGLSSVTLPAGIQVTKEAFSDCKNLTTLIIPEGVTEIGSLAFQRCSSLTSISLPSTIKILGNWAFEGCSSLAIVNIPETVTNINFEGVGTLAGQATFRGCVKMSLASQAALKRLGYNGSF